MDSHLTRTEVCRLLGVSEKSLYLWERDGRIPRPKRDRRNWRVYSAADVAAIRQFLGPDRAGKQERADHLGTGGRSSRRSAGRIEGLSARNQLIGRVVAIRREGLLCEVVIRLGDGQEITSIITGRSEERLGLWKGSEITAVIKATEVMLFR